MNLKNHYVAAVMVLAFAALACSSPAELLPTQTPYPTLTPYPTFTPVPLPTNTPEPTVLMENDFSSSDCFDTPSDQDVKRSLDGEQLNIEILTPQIFAWSNCTAQEFSDFVLEVDATQVGGPDNNDYGIIFRYNSSTNEYYTFQISGDGYYMVNYSGATPEASFILLNWAAIPDVKKGNSTNHLKVSAIGDEITVYVNDVMVGFVRSNILKSGYVGLSAGAFDVANVKISFDNLKITKP